MFFFNFGSSWVFPAVRNTRVANVRQLECILTLSPCVRLISSALVHFWNFGTIAATTSTSSPLRFRKTYYVVLNKKRRCVLLRGRHRHHKSFYSRLWTCRRYVCKIVLSTKRVTQYQYWFSPHCCSNNKVCLAMEYFKHKIVSWQILPQEKGTLRLICDRTTQEINALLNPKYISTSSVDRRCSV